MGLLGFQQSPTSEWCTSPQYCLKFSHISIQLHATVVSGTLSKPEGARDGAWSLQTIGLFTGDSSKEVADHKILVDDRVPTSQYQKFPLPLQRSPGARLVKDGRKNTNC